MNISKKNRTEFCCCEKRRFSILKISKNVIKFLCLAAWHDLFIYSIVLRYAFSDYFYLFLFCTISSDIITVVK